MILNWHGRIVARYRKTIDNHAPWAGRLFRQLRDRAVDSKVRQTRYGFTLAGEELVASEDWENVERATFDSLLGSHDCVVDVGANVGFYSCLAASRGKCVIAIEPSPRNVDYLKGNLWRNRFQSVEVLPVALGKRPGLMPIYGYGCTASLVPDWGQVHWGKGLIVPVSTLDRLIADSFTGKRLLIKVDVEGFEYEVLEGAGQVLNRTPRPTWLIEILSGGDFVPGGANSRFFDTFDVFWRNGYQCQRLGDVESVVTPDDVRRWAHDDQDNSSARNFLFSCK